MISYTHGKETDVRDTFLGYKIYEKNWKRNTPAILQETQKWTPPIPKSPAFSLERFVVLHRVLEAGFSMSWCFRVCSVEVEMCALPQASGVWAPSGDLGLYKALGCDWIRLTSLGVEGGAGELNQEPLIPSQVAETGAFPRFLELLCFSARYRLNRKHPMHCLKTRSNIQISFWACIST